jgi:hypothetical protein
MLTRSDVNLTRGELLRYVQEMGAVGSFLRSDLVKATSGTPATGTTL